MGLIRQVIQILSEPPGSFIYHLITLFALQVVFAISYSRWRRQPQDDYARHMFWAAGAIFVGRLILLLAGLYYGRDAQSAANILPPLEHAINTASVLLIVWALVPPMERYPRALDILLIGALIGTGILYFFFAQEWQSQLAAGETAFHGTTQATMWTLMQIAILATGWGYLLFKGRHLGALPLIIIGVLLIAHVVHLWNYPEFIPTDTNVAYWIRLGNLIAYPLWGVYAYLYAMRPLLESESKLHGSIENFGISLDQAAQVIATQQPQRRLTYALIMMSQIFDSSFAAIGLLEETTGGDADNNLVSFYSLPPEQSPGELKTWGLDLGQHATLSAALRQGGATELQRDGLGSRQLFDFFEAANIEPTHTLLVYPMTINNNTMGMLVLSPPGKNGSWTEDKQSLLPGLAHFITQAMVNSQIARVVEEAEPASENLVPTVGVPAAIVMDKARLGDLEYQLDKLSKELQEAEKKRRQAEINAAAAQKQARYLAAALRAAQPSAPGASRTAVDRKVSRTASQENSEADIDRVS